MTTEGDAAAGRERPHRASADRPDPELGPPDRLIGLSDGVYAIALTLLVLDISVPDGLDADQFAPALRQQLPQLGAYALSFVVIALFWRGHRRMFMHVVQIDGPLTRIALVGIGLVALFPFPTSLLAEYGNESAAVASYAATIAAIDLTHLLVALRLRARPRLTAPDIDPKAALPLTDLAVTVAVFTVSIPVAFVSPSAGALTWLLLIPAGIAAGRLRRRGAGRPG